MTLEMAPLAEGLSAIPHRCGALLLLLLLSLLARGLDASNGTLENHTSPVDHFTFHVGIGGHGPVNLTFKETSVLTLNVSSSDEVGHFELRSADLNIFHPTQKITLEITENTSFPMLMNMSLRGEYIGESVLQVFNSDEDLGPLASAAINVQPPFQTLGTIATIILTVWLVISYVIMAAKVEPRVLLQKIKPPWGIIMGMVCQFILMPPLAYAVAKVFGMTGAQAVGLVLVGTCPGGFFSNIEVLLLDCDIVLSLTMTTFSTFLAVGMMPLNLLIYAQPFVEGNNNLETPFQSLLIQLCGLVMPLLLGVPFFYHFERAREKCLKLVKPFTFILMLLGVVLFIPSQYYIFYGDWKVWTTSAILPALGAFLGISIARIANFNYTFSITVAIETGCQNTLLAVSVAKLFYGEPESHIVAIIPLLIAMVTGFEGISVAALYYLFRIMRGKLKKRTDSSEDVETDTDQMECTERNGHAVATANGGAYPRETPGVQYIIPGSSIENGERPLTRVPEKFQPPAPAGFGCEEEDDRQYEAERGRYEAGELRENSLYPEEPPDRPHSRRGNASNGLPNDGFMSDKDEWLSS